MLLPLGYGTGIFILIQRHIHQAAGQRSNQFAHKGIPLEMQPANGALAGVTFIGLEKFHML